MDIKLPPQKKTYKQKTKKWRKECADALDTGISYHFNASTRRTVRNKYINQNLYEGKLDMQDMVKVLNPGNMIADFVPKHIQHQPIMVPKIDLLVGEELKRPFDWAVMVGDPTGISRKVEDKKALIDKRISELIENTEKSDDDIKTELNKLGIYFRYEWKDLREVRASKLLHHYWKALQFKEKFNEGFKDALINGEEIYQCDIQGNEPTFERLNNSKVYTVRSGYSSKVEDSDIIIVEDYWSPGKIIDTFYDQLKSKEIDRLSEGYVSSDGNFSQEAYAQSFIIGEPGVEMIDGLLSAVEIGGNEISKVYVDNSGNVRVIRGYWRSQKQVLRVTYMDEEGDPQTKIMSEEYILDEGRGETAEKLWVNEWWEMTKVGSDIYLSMQPKQVQYSRLSNPSKGHPGIVGEIYNFNQGKSTSMVDRMKSYQYLYDIIWYRVNRAIEKNLGKILEMDLAKMPAKWDVHKWMSFAVDYGIGFVDSSKEINKGPAQGKTAGIYNTTGKAIDVETGNYIQQHINLLEYIKSEMSEIVGITPQRQGAISSQETVGGVERAVMQSSNNTEWWFQKHERLKLRALSIFLETAKIALKGNKLKLQHILDDFSTEVFEIDGDEFSEMDYDVFVLAENRVKEMDQTLNQMAHAFMQNGGNMSVVMDILFSQSMADKRKRVELAEFDRAQQEQAKQEQAAKMQEQALAEAKEEKERDREVDMYKTDANNAAKIIIEEMKQGGADKKLDLDERTSSKDVMLRIKELEQEMKQHHEKIQVEKKKASMKKVS